MIVTYEGTDITSLVEIDKCVWDAREEGRVPQLLIAFDDLPGLWDSWSPEQGDCVSVSDEGAAATGKMYVKTCMPVAGGFELRADALPVSDSVAVRAWRQTTLRVVVKQLADTLGLKTSFHGCDDMIFSYIRQECEGALPVIARITTLAGCIFDVYDGTLHVCGREWVESQASTGELEIAVESEYEYRDKSPYAACSLIQTEIAGVRKGFTAKHGKSGRTIELRLDERVGVPGTRELDRACAGILACVNARLSGGYAKADSLLPFTPGSTCTVSCEKAPSLSGAAVITRVRNDFERRKSKTWWRKLQ